MIPKERPKLTREELEKMLPPIDRLKYPLFTVGIRGYYQDTMGKPGVNDRGIYDDAIFVLSDKVFAAYNGNTDPSVQYRLGLAVLKKGVYYAHRIGLHKGKYTALVQWAGPVTIIRDGEGETTGYFGINQHRGGQNTTSSEGCQTIPEPQYTEFITLVESEARRLYGDKYNEKCIPYILL